MPSQPQDKSEPEFDASYLIASGIGNRQGKLICTIDVQPRDQSRVSLGKFTSDDKLKGFSIEITPEPDSPDSIVTHITNLGTSSQSRLVLHIANFGDKAISADVRQL